MVQRTQMFLIALLLVGFGAGVGAAQQEGGPPPEPPARKIPGITEKDDHPDGCVDCHKNMPERKMDARFSTLLKKWQVKVPDELLEKTKQAAPEGMKITGEHPKVRADLTTEEIPGACMECHAKKPRNTKKQGPPFARLIHRIHLVGGDENHFMTFYQGECTHCHKLDTKTGQWSLGHGTEAEPHEHGHAQ